MIQTPTPLTFFMLNKRHETAYMRRKANCRKNKTGLIKKLRHWVPKGAYAEFHLEAI